MVLRGHDFYCLPCCKSLVATVVQQKFSPPNSGTCRGLNKMCGTCKNLVIMDLMDLQEKMVLITKKG